MGVCLFAGVKCRYLTPEGACADDQTFRAGWLFSRIYTMANVAVMAIGVNHTADRNKGPRSAPRLGLQAL